MGKAAKKSSAKAKALELKNEEPLVPTTPEPVAVQHEGPTAPIPHPVIGRNVRGHKYDGKFVDLSNMKQVLGPGKYAPNPPRGATGKPSVKYRIYGLVVGNPGITIKELVETCQARASEFISHPSPYTKKPELEAAWVLGYLRGMVREKFLTVE